MSTNVVADHAAWICGLLAMACLAAWPLFRTRNTMLLVQLAALTGLSLHYALLGVTTAATVNALGVMQIAASLLLGVRPRLRWIGYALAAVMVMASAITWQGLVSALAASGMALVAIGRAQTSASVMRTIVLAGGPFWLAHDLLIESPVAVADALSLVLGLGALAWRRFKPRTASRNGSMAAIAVSDDAAKARLRALLDKRHPRFPIARWQGREEHGRSDRSQCIGALPYATRRFRASISEYTDMVIVHGDLPHTPRLAALRELRGVAPLSRALAAWQLLRIS